jgi:probable F420-dependent oxidoreductase
MRHPSTGRDPSMRTATAPGATGVTPIGAVTYDPVMATTAAGTMQIGIVLPMSGADRPGATAWPVIRDVARHAEAGGADSLWVYDHLLFRMPDEPEDGIHEAFTILAAVAAVTERARLGSLVFATSFRHPAVFAKMAATLDTVAGGRLILGLGCGWHEPEYRAFGLPFDHRVARFAEALEVIVPLVHGERVTFEGRWTRTEDAVLIPPPIRPARMAGRVPILIAAKGERMLRLTARHADAWNAAWFGRPDERFATRLTELHAACDAEGRDPATLEVTAGVIVDGPGDIPASAPFRPLPADVDAIARAFDAWRDAAAGSLIVDARPGTEAMIDLVLDAVRRHRGG